MSMTQIKPGQVVQNAITSERSKYVAEHLVSHILPRQDRFLPTAELEGKLDTCLNEGWEFVSFCEMAGGFVVIFKRMIRKPI